MSIAIDTILIFRIFSNKVRTAGLIVMGQALSMRFDLRKTIVLIENQSG